ncbi:hypothetical protein BO71DRAFT_434373 [Aspergillus ellipticus CBS 707.79]|uniref:Uncharacterized protein n=1 Tax=Aspergillus ellipticus CBS 707.79 TaxID=1448320 RepID=A0A319CZ18_9EURO|nr:hypothetical protein BO71DRAFT_434373 [Aspergillus ellipticus CBS 707.79]
MIVGSLEGWWVGEADGRKWGPVLTESDWNDALIRAGFSGVNVCLPDWTDPRDHFLSVLVSSATPPEAEHVPSEVVIIEPETPTEELKRFSGKLRESICGHGAEVSVATLKEVALLDDIKSKSCLTLLECDPEQPLLSDVSPEDWNTLKTVIL